MNPLGTGLSQHPPPRDVVVSCLWGQRPGPWRLFNNEKSSEIDYNAYFDYYHRQWEYFSQQGSVCFTEFDDIRETIRQLKNGASREDVVLELDKHQKTESQTHTNEVLQTSINFAARILVMVKLGRLQHEVPQRRTLDWESGSLREFLRHRFPSTPQIGCENVRLTKTFDAWSLENVGGIRIQFTDNLADHLRLVDDDEVVLIFHHASFLEHQNTGYVHGYKLNLNPGRNRARLTA